MFSNKQIVTYSLGCLDWTIAKQYYSNDAVKIQTLFATVMTIHAIK